MAVERTRGGEESMYVASRNVTKARRPGCILPLHCKVSKNTMAGAADVQAAIPASNELLVILEATERATNFTLTEDGLHLVSVDTSASSATKARPAGQQEQ